VASILTAGELGLWRRMSGPDRRHAVGVARDVAARLGGDRPSEVAAPVLAAALLHDVGKVESGLGTLARVPVTILGELGGRGRIKTGRVGRYFEHPAIGARLLSSAGSDPLVVTWAAEHHLPADRWTLPSSIASALKAADDD
jgi:hypothetical protein